MMPAQALEIERVGTIEANFIWLDTGNDKSFTDRLFTYHWSTYADTMKAIMNSGQLKKTVKDHFPETLAFISRMIEHNLKEGKSGTKAKDRAPSIAEFITACRIEKSALEGIAGYAAYKDLQQALKDLAAEKATRRTSVTEARERRASFAGSIPPEDIEADKERKMIISKVVEGLAAEAQNLQDKITFLKAGGSLDTNAATRTLSPEEKVATPSGIAFVSHRSSIGTPPVKEASNSPLPPISVGAGSTMRRSSTTATESRRGSVESTASLATIFLQRWNRKLMLISIKR